MNYYQICQETVAPAGSTEYYSLYSLALPIREAVLAVKAFHHTIQQIHYDCSEDALAQTKFAWWQQEIENLFAEKPQHPISHALQPVIQQYGFEKTLFLDLISGIQTNTRYNAYHNAADLIQHGHRASHTKMHLLAKIFSFEKSETLQFAHDLGIGLALFDLVYSFRRDLQKGNIYFPKEDIEKLGLNMDQLLQEPLNQDWQALLTLQCERIDTFFQQALKHLATADYFKQRSLLINYQLTNALLPLLKNNLNDVLTHHVQLTPLKKLYIAWRTVRLAKKQRLT